jgi:hypothetical protein
MNPEQEILAQIANSLADIQAQLKKTNRRVEWATAAIFVLGFALLCVLIFASCLL